MDFILSLIGSVNAYSKTNPIVAGAVSLWGLGVLTWLCRNIPANLWSIVRTQYTTTLILDNQEIGNNFETYYSFLEWLSSSEWIKYSRTIKVTGRYVSGEQGLHKGIVVGIGPGTSLFRHKGKFFFVTRSEQSSSDNQAGGKIHSKISITCLGRNRKYLLDMILEFAPSNVRSTEISIHQFMDNYWQALSVTPRRSLESVIIHGGIKEEIVSEIEQWLRSKDWYAQRGLPYKLTYAIHGVPGTGKTTLLKALASHFNLGISVLNIGHLSDAEFSKALATAPDKTMIVIEDFDSQGALKKRDGVESSRSEITATIRSVNPKTNKIDGLSFLTLSGVLNAMDGIVSLHNRLVFMTTNVIDDIDPAVLRHGRVDHIKEIKLLGHDDIVKYVELMFEGHSPKGIYFEQITGAELQHLYYANRDSVTDFVCSIPTLGSNTKVQNVRRFGHE